MKIRSAPKTDVERPFLDMKGNVLNQQTRPNPEGYGEKFSTEAMLAARQQTFDAVYRIAPQITVGMTQEEATGIANRVLEDMGAEKIWHKTLVRFGPDTIEPFQAKGDKSRVLQQDDIYFVDLGVVWQGHEGDAGDTFTVGTDADMARCASDARKLWHDVAQKWRTEKLTGQALYDYAVTTAEAWGWRLILETRGHRVSDFPHAIYKASRLGDFSACPAAGLWILEIQIAHPTRPFGAFYEDLLMEGKVLEPVRK